MDHPAPDLPERYELGHPFGQGGTSVVWYCFDHVLGAEVAVKVLRPGVGEYQRKAFRDEAELTAMAAGENVVRVLDAGHDQGPGVTPYIVMEFLDGHTLGHRIAFNGAFPVDEAADTAARIADALSTAHEAGVLHRDVKPGNVMLVDGLVKLIDFGYAASRRHGLGLDAVVGTPGYLPPDKARAFRNALGTAFARRPPSTEQDDLYAFGVTLYEMVAGEPAFGPAPKKTLKAQAEGRMPRLAQVAPGVPAELDRLVVRLTAKDPRDRPGSAAEVRDRLFDIAENAPHRIVGTRGVPIYQASPQAVPEENAAHGVGAATSEAAARQGAGLPLNGLVPLSVTAQGLGTVQMGSAKESRLGPGRAPSVEHPHTAPHRDNPARRDVGYLVQPGATTEPRL